MATQRHRSSAVPLAWLYGALIVYASLYPFTGWRIPGVGPLDFLILRAHGWTRFDLISNLLGYLPLGFLLFVALVRSGRTLRVGGVDGAARRDDAVVHDGAAAELPAAARLLEHRPAAQRHGHGARRPHRPVARLPRRDRALADGARSLVRRPQRRRHGAAPALADRPALSDRGAVRPRPRARPGAAGRRRDAAGHVGRGLGGGAGPTPPRRRRRARRSRRRASSRSSSSACSRPAWWPSRSPCRAGGAARW